MSNFYEHGNRAYSYGTCIKDVLPDGRTIGNVTKYSATTSKHQKAAEVSKCDILVDNVPKGAADLTRLTNPMYQGALVTEITS